MAFFDEEFEPEEELATVKEVSNLTFRTDGLELELKELKKKLNEIITINKLKIKEKQ